jgi:hypothetical protein
MYLSVYMSLSICMKKWLTHFGLWHTAVERVWPELKLKQIWTTCVPSDWTLLCDFVVNTLLAYQVGHYQHQQWLKEHLMLLHQNHHGRSLSGNSRRNSMTCSMWLDCFSTVHDGKIVKKTEFSRALLHGETALTTADINQAVNVVVRHTFVHQSLEYWWTPCKSSSKTPSTLQ